MDDNLKFIPDKDFQNFVSDCNSLGNIEHIKQRYNRVAIRIMRLIMILKNGQDCQDMRNIFSENQDKVRIVRILRHESLMETLYDSYL